MADEEKFFDGDKIVAQADEDHEDWLQALVFQSIGAGSVCWDDPGAAGTFHSERAKQIGDEVVRVIRQRAGI